MFWQLIIVAVVLIPILAIVLDSQFGRAIARRMERPKLGAGEEGGGHERVTVLEAEVDRLGREVERLDEESQFLQKLLASRTSDDGAATGGDRRRTPSGPKET